FILATNVRPGKWPAFARFVRLWFVIQCPHIARLGGFKGGFPRLKTGGDFTFNEIQLGAIDQHSWMAKTSSRNNGARSGLSGVSGRGIGGSNDSGSQKRCHEKQP